MIFNTVSFLASSSSKEKLWVHRESQSFHQRKLKCANKLLVHLSGTSKIPIFFEYIIYKMSFSWLHTYNAKRDV